MRPNPIKTLLMSTILVITGLASLSVQAQTRPRRVSPNPKTDAVLLSETRPRQVEAHAGRVDRLDILDRGEVARPGGAQILFEHDVVEGE